MLRRLGIAAALCELTALVVAGLMYVGGQVGPYRDPLSLSEAFNIGWGIFFLTFLPACLLYVRRNDVQVDGDRIVHIAEARLDGRRAILLRARSRRK